MTKSLARGCEITLVCLVIFALASSNIASISAAIYTPNSIQTWAVIVCGGSSGGSQQEDFENEIAEAYNTLLSRAYDADHIYYLDITFPRDVTGDGINDVDAVSNKANVQNAITSWLKTRSDSNDVCFLYLVNHGDVDAFTIPGGPIYAYEMAGWLFHVTYGELIFTLEACHSGSFIDELSETNRIIVSSCEANELAWPDPNTDWPAFSHTFFQRLAAMDSIGDAFNVAYQHVIQVRPTQHPTLDDNGDEVGHRGPLPNGGDGNLALNMCWMPGDLDDDEIIDITDIAAVAYAYGTNWTRADINHDGIVEMRDVVIVARAYGTSCDPKWDQRADLNDDWIIDIMDVSIVARAYGSTPGDPNWDPRADINQDGVVDMIDITIVSSVYGSICDPSWDPRADLNDDWTVDDVDLDIVSQAYGSICDPRWDARADLNCDWVIDDNDIDIASTNYGYFP
ncbi:MAG: dockerin type I domain-containing protein [Candidatus Bathyarchaeota archaeon]|nr:dockerin type I domain-containing protein [Candidatus Bathyarchaeota archaeon]MDH5494657.1 dockerin type I domain-containing protein [Candidatus Bathyarchaeota archaeon]